MNITLTDYFYPMIINTGATATIILVGDNTLTAISTADNNTGRGIVVNGALTIRGNGSLSATGSGDDNGIGSVSGNNSINIRGGKITATGGSAFGGGGAGINGNVSIDFTNAPAGSFVRAIGGGGKPAFSKALADQTGVGSHRIGNSPQTDGPYAFDPSHTDVTLFKNINVPPTGLPNLTAATTWLYILIALSLALWGYVGYTYIAPRRKS